MLVVLEGLDGAGKSTQVAKFREYLSRVCQGEMEYIHFPRYDSPVYGSLISRFLRGEFGSIESVHPQLVALLFAEDRHNAAGEIRRVLESGGTVLLDRYVYSNIAYQCAKLGSDSEAEALRRWILDTEYGDFNLPRPDLNIFLDVPVSFIEESLCRKRDGHDRDYLEGGHDIHEASMEFQKKVRDIYRREAAGDDSFIPIDCSDENGRMLPAEIIFEKIRKVYEETPKA